MQSISLNVRALRPIRLLLVACVFALLFFVSVLPAYAAVKSPSEGEDKLLGIEKESQELVGKDPYTMKEQVEKTNSGLNVVQGDANKENMITPATTDETSVEDQIKNVFEKITGKD